MNERERRLKYIQLQLTQMYQDLFGGKYIPGLQNSEKAQFNTIIEAFRQRIYHIRQTQEERQKKQKKKGFKQSAEQVRLNQEIRDQIKKAETILGEAVRRMNTDLKGKQKGLTKKMQQNRQQAIKNCYELLKDVKEIDEGGVYKPPKPQQTLQQIKKLVNRKQDNDEINSEQQNALDAIKIKDQNIDKLLDEVIDVDGEIKRNLMNTNQMIGITDQKIKNNMSKATKLDTQVRKANSDLVQVLKNYRRPNKLCLDITFVLLLLALIGVIINMIKNGGF